MSEPTGSLDERLAQWKNYSDRQFRLNIGKWVIPDDLRQAMEREMSDSRLHLLPWNPRLGGMIWIDREFALAIKRDDLETVTSIMLDYPLKISGALPLAARLGRLLIVQSLLASGAHEIGPALKDAVSGGYLDVVKLLLSYGAGDLDPLKGLGLMIVVSLAQYISTIDGLVQSAVKNNHPAIVEALLTKRGEELTKALRSAVEQRDSELVRLLLLERGASYFKEILPVAAKAGQHEMLHLLIEHGYNDLQWAADYMEEIGRLEVGETLLANTVGYINDALKVAAEEGHLAVVQAMVEDEDEDRDLNGALAIAAARGHLAVVEYLLKAGASNIEEALVIASSNGHSAVAELLNQARQR